MSGNVPAQKSDRIPVKTEYGTFLLEFSAKGLYAVRFPTHYSPCRDPVSTGVEEAIRRRFKSPGKLPRVKLDLSGCTPFQRKVYRALMKVPAGTTVTYGELARKAGYPKAARAAGNAMKENRLPIVIPCHRVVPSTGGIGEYSQGVQWKRLLLEQEKYCRAKHKGQGLKWKLCALRVEPCAPHML